MANIGNHEIFFGAVFTTEGGGGDVYPSWWNQNADPVNYFKEWFAEELSEHYVDLCFKCKDSNGTTNGLAYYRIYADGENGAEIIVSGSDGAIYAWYNRAKATKMGYRYIKYHSDGTMYDYPGQHDWSSNYIKIAQCSDSSRDDFFDMSYFAIIRKKEPFFVHNMFNDVQIL